MGLKNGAICHLFLNGQKTVSSGDLDWDGFFEGRLRRFWSSHCTVTTPTRMEPTEEQPLPFAAKKIGRKPRKLAVMAAHEFARLIGVLTKYDEARSAHFVTDLISIVYSNKDPET